MGRDEIPVVREFPSRVIVLAAVGVAVAVGLLCWTAYDGIRQARETTRILQTGQSLQAQLFVLQQRLSGMLVMESATGDLRWSIRYNRVREKINALVVEGRQLSEVFSERVDALRIASTDLGNMQSKVVELLRQNKVSEAQAFILGDEYSARQAVFRHSFEDLDREIERLTLETEDRFKKRFLVSVVTTIVISVFSVLVWITSATRVREWRETLSTTVEELHRHEAELEDRVRLRTEELANVQGLLQAAVDYMPGGIFMVDQSLKVQLYNKGFLNLYNIPEDIDLMGQSIEVVFRIRAERGEYGTGDIETLVAQRVQSYREEPTAQYQDYIIASDRTIDLQRAALPDGSIVAIFNDVTERQRAADLLEDAHAVMRDSIQYASRIQRSLLPSDSRLSDMFGGYFCLWQPRDVVGGDMYWVREDRRGYFVVLFDCTGHGVPGALMTTISVAALNIAFTETGDPARLMTRVNQIIKESLGQVDENGLSDDGLEMGVCLVEPDRMRVTYAGARFELLSVSPKEKKLIKGDKSGIGYRHVPYDRRFTSHSLRLERGQRFYMFSDGVTDQIGGERRRAFGRKRLLKLIEDVDHLPMAPQGVAIEKALNEYRGEEPRRDDVSMIGFKPLH